MQATLVILNECWKVMENIIRYTGHSYGERGRYNIGQLYGRWGQEELGAKLWKDGQIRLRPAYGSQGWYNYGGSGTYN